MVALLECVTLAGVVAAVVERGVAVLGARAGLVAVVSDDGDSMEVAGSWGYPDEMLSAWRRFPLSEPLPLSDAVRENQALLFEGQADWRARYPALLDRFPADTFQASASLPLSARGRCFGALHFSFPGERRFTEADRAILAELTRQCALALDRAILLERAERARDAAEAANRRLEFLARASAILSESLGYQSRMEELTRLCVPELADWAGVDVVGPEGQLVRVAVAHRDPEREAVIRTIQERYPPDRQRSPNTLTVIESGKPILLHEITPEMIARGAVDAEHARLLKQVGLSAALSLPLSARGRTLGALTVGLGPKPEGSGRIFSPEAIALVEELARRAAVAMDNANLHRSVQNSEARYRNLFEHHPQPMFVLDMNTLSVLNVNQAAVRHYGYSREEFLALRATDLRPPEEVPRFLALVPTLEDLPHIQQGEWRHRTKDGTAIDVEVVSPPLSYDGRPARLVAVTDVTERVAAEQARHEAEERYARLLETAREGVLFVDAHARISRVNAQFARMLGYDSGEELVGREAFSLFFPEDEARAREKWAARRAGVGEAYEVRLKARDGSERWFIAHVTIETDRDTGAFLGTFTLFTDHTERRKTLEALQTKSAEVTTILESITDAFFALDHEWRFSYVNAEAERMLQGTREALVGRRIWEAFPAAVGSEFEAQFQRAMRERTTVTFQAHYPPPLDAWFDVRGYPSEAGLSVYFRDITDERRREEERERLLAELERLNARQLNSLEQSEERFRLMVEGVRDYAIFMLDPEGHISTWNAGAQRFKGYAPEEIIGRHFSVFYTPEDIARRHPEEELVIARREGQYEEEGWRIRKDGSRFWAHVVITALRDKQGRLHGFGKVTRDVTERREREMERAAAEALEQQRRFLKDVLASVTQGRLVLCDSPNDLPPPLTSEPEAPPIPLSRHALRTVRGLVNDVADRCDMPTDRKQALVTAASEGAMNAVQHAGGGTATVYGDLTSGTVQVWVEDTGKGIDLSHLPRATLEPGFSTGGGGIGHGFSIMIACCSRVYLLTGTDGTTVVLEQARQAPEPAWLQLVGG